jgi:hypothetical protein
MNAALGVRFLAGVLAALFLAGTALAVATFFAGAVFLAGVVFAVAMLRFLCAQVDSEPMTPICSGCADATGENPSFYKENSFFHRGDICMRIWHVRRVAVGDRDALIQGLHES